jgi:exosome complex component RRP42
MIWGDGGECIVGIKAEVEKTLSAGAGGIGTGIGSDWVEINVEVSGQREDDAFLGMTVAESLLVPGAGLAERLVINERFHWRVYVDVSFL